MNEIGRGAEAILVLNDEGQVLKDRIQKGYRLPVLDDAIRIRRTRAEARLIREARSAGVNTPQIFDVSSTVITMEMIDGPRLKTILNDDNFQEIGEMIGETLARLHNANIIHGDFTTSNVIMSDTKMFVIDFGLGFESRRIEDRAVDLTLLHGAIVSAHFDIADRFWPVILKAYNENNDEADKVIKTFGEIQKRGRYKER